MLEPSAAGPVWRPTLAPHPVKNLVVEPVALYFSAGGGTSRGDYIDWDYLTVDLVLNTKNTGRTDVKDVLMNAKVFFGAAPVKTIVERSGNVPAGYESETTIEGLYVEAATSPQSKLFLDTLNAQDPRGPPLAPVSVAGDFVVPMRGPLDKVHVANARTITRSLPLQSRSGRPPRLLE